MTSLRLTLKQFLFIAAICVSVSYNVGRFSYIYQQIRNQTHRRPLPPVYSSMNYLNDSTTNGSDSLNGCDATSSIADNTTNNNTPTYEVIDSDKQCYPTQSPLDDYNCNNNTIHQEQKDQFGKASSEYNDRNCGMQDDALLKHQQNRSKIIWDKEIKWNSVHGDHRSQIHRVDNIVAFFEAAVHPSILIHPRTALKIVLINDTSCGMLREVLKYKQSTVRKVYYVEASKIPEWCVCVNVVDGRRMPFKCFTDPRVEIIPMKHIASYDMNENQNEKSSFLIERNSIDIVYMDSSTHEKIPDHNFLRMISNILLAECGILTSHVGTKERVKDIPSKKNNATRDIEKDIFKEHVWSGYIDSLEKSNSTFHSIVDYNEQNSKFVIAMKCEKCRWNWMLNEAEMHIHLSHRFGDNNESLSSFDSAAMMQYQYTSRIVEEFWCRGKELQNALHGESHSSDKTLEMDIDARCFQSHGYDPEKGHVSSSAFEVKNSLAANGGRGVFTKQKIPKGSMIMIDECANGIILPMKTSEILLKAEEEWDNISSFWHVVSYGFFTGYGWDAIDVYDIAGVDSSISTFMNHGCNGTYNTGTIYDFTEMNAMNCINEQHQPCLRCGQKIPDRFNPFHARTYPLWFCGENVALRDIEMGEEMLDNYICYGGDEYFAETVAELKDVCSGGIGRITKYDMEGVENK